jgi:hypothetical protein
MHNEPGHVCHEKAHPVGPIAPSARSENLQYRLMPMHWIETAVNETIWLIAFSPWPTMEP